MSDSKPDPSPNRPSTVRIRLAPGREKAVLHHGHPWLFSGAVAAVEGSVDAPLAHVFAHDGRDLGLGFHNPRSQIRVRLLGPGVESVDRTFFAKRLAQAQALRETVVPPETTGYRLLNAEGDGVPGWTVDRFGDVLVSQITAAGLEAVRGEAYAALTAAWPDHAVLQANELTVRETEGLPTRDEVIAPAAGSLPREARFRESGLTFFADLAGGQKTGFYCDQRDNRRRVEGFAAGRSLLDLFAHTGAFGVYARRGGAGRIVHVESSARLIEQGKRVYEANGFGSDGTDSDATQWHEANVFEWLRQPPGDLTGFGIVVVDPPPLVAKRADLDRGARAYKDVNRLALRRVARGGFYLTFSCSAAVDARLFRQVLFSASREARVRLQLLAPLAAAPDHPVDVTHPEGEYLKGWLGRVV